MCSPPRRGPLPLLLRRDPGELEALAEANGGRPGVERANALAGLALGAGCLLALLFVLLTG
jgi:hypothetical protein